MDNLKKSYNIIEITKLRTNFELRYSFNKSLTEFIKNLPRDQQQTKMEIVRRDDGSTFEDWYRVVNEAALARIIDFIKSNNLRFRFTNLSLEEIEKLKTEFQQRLTRGEEALKARAKDLDVSDLEIPNMKVQPYDYQKQAAVFFEKADGKAILGDSPGVGKSQNLNALIATPNGWVRMGDIKIGQEVLHHSGLVSKVTGIFPQGNRQSYKVTFSDGFFTYCDMEHLWVTRESNRRRRKAGWVVKKLKEIVESGLYDNNTTRRALTGRQPTPKWDIPIVSHINYKEKNFVIPPYILGVAIGDGNICSGSITISIPDFQSEITEHINSLLTEDVQLVKAKISDNFPNSCPRYRITKQNTIRNNYHSEVIKLGLNVKSGYKFIPKKYLQGSQEQRLELLKGLMDTDGSIKDNRINFHTSSEQLAKDVCELIQSLGGIAILKKYDRSKEEKGIEWRVNVRMSECPFKLSSKANLWRPAKRFFNRRYIKSVEIAKIEPHQCISVNSPDNTYITDNYIVTHNTMSAIAYAVKNKLKTLVICPASLKLNWKNEILRFTNEKAYIYKYKPKKRSKETLFTKEESLFHIINYEALETFIKLSISHRCSNYQCGWKETNTKKKYIECPSCKKAKTVKSRVLGTQFEDKDGVSLDPKSYDLIVCDEAHYLKNPKANRTKVVKKSFSDMPKKLLLTGTAIKSVPYEFFSLLNFIDPSEWKNAHQFGVRYCAGFQDSFGWDYSGSSNLDELYRRISPYFLRRLKSDVLTFLPPKTYTHLLLELSPEEYREYSAIEKKVVSETEENSNDADHLSRIQKLKMFTSHLKAKQSFEIIQSIIDGGEKVVVFSEYISTAEKVKEQFGEQAVIFTGKKNMSEKQEAVDKFMNDDNVKVFVGTIGAAGVGITLTVSSTALFIDQPWTPADREQAEDRIHRASTTADKVQIIRMVCQDTIDEDIIALLNTKEKVTSQVLDAKSLERKVDRVSGSIFRDLVAVLINKK